MAFNQRRNSRHKEPKSTRRIICSGSSDIDSDVPLMEKLKLNRPESSLENSHTACQRNISHHTSSSESLSFSTKENNKRKYMNVTDKSNTKKSTDNIGYQRPIIYQSNKSENTSTKNSIRKRRKCVIIKKAMQTDLDDKCSRNSNEIVVNQCVRNCKGTESEKQAIVQNFKPFIKKVIENLKNTFSKFRFQMHRLQLKYLELDIITLQDAADIIFIFSSVICKMKEELSEKQQDLTNSYIDRIIKYNSNGAVSNVNYDQFNKDLQEQVETSSTSSSSSQLYSPNICQKQYVKTNKSSSRGVQKNDKETLPMQETNSYINNYQTKDNALIPNNKSTESQLDRLKMVESIETSWKKFVASPEEAEDSKSNNEVSNKDSTNASEKLAADVNKHTAKQSVIEIVSSSDSDSNMSTCSTVMISSKTNRHKGNRKCAKYSPE